MEGSPDQGHGLCRRYPPGLAPGPFVGVDRWCGEFAAVPESETEPVPEPVVHPVPTEPVAAKPVPEKPAKATKTRKLKK
jgi:hypothetical protein